MTAVHRGRILVVDDMPNMRSLLNDILAPQHDLAVAPDGMLALAKLEGARFDVVLTDVRMPGLNGFEVVRMIKDRWPLTEIVMMTAFASIPAAVEAVRIGAYDYIQKPFDPDDVRLIITRALEHSRERARSPQKGSPIPGATPGERLANVSYREALAGARDRGSREYLAALLSTFGGNVSRAAERAGLERESLHRLLRRYGIQPNEFRASGQDRFE
jgi:DNA-binding NtrC family response regulator